MRDRRVRTSVLLLVAASVLAGCKGGGSVHFGGGQTDTVPVTMSMTDTPPAGVSVLSFQDDDYRRATQPRECRSCWLPR